MVNGLGQRLLPAGAGKRSRWREARMTF